MEEDKPDDPETDLELEAPVEDDRMARKEPKIREEEGEGEGEGKGT